MMAEGRASREEQVVSSEHDTRHKGMKQTDWTSRVGLPASQVYQVLFALASGDVRRPIRGVSEVKPLGDGRSAWVVDARGRRMDLSVAVTGQSPHDSMSLAATGKGVEVAMDVALRSLDAGSTQCSLTLYRHLSFAFEIVAAPILRAQHDRIARELAPGLEDIARDYPEFAGSDRTESTAR
jgi:uncharacterized membrane protein